MLYHSLFSAQCIRFLVPGRDKPHKHGLKSAKIFHSTTRIKPGYCLKINCPILLSGVFQLFNHRYSAVLSHHPTSTDRNCSYMINMGLTTPPHPPSSPTLINASPSPEDYYSEDPYADDYEDDDSSSPEQMPPANPTNMANSRAARSKHLLSMAAGIERTKQQNAELQAKLNQLLGVNVLLQQENVRLREELRIADWAIRTAEEMTKTKCPCEECAEKARVFEASSINKEFLMSLVQRIRDNESRQKQLMEVLNAARVQKNGRAEEHEKELNAIEDDSQNEEDVEHEDDPDYEEDAQHEADLEPEEELKHKKPQSAVCLMIVSNQN
jgi:hypothetical protein